MQPREVILHIGPPKCASTTMQHALRARERELAASGVRVITRHSDAVADLFGGRYLSEIVTARKGAWNELVREAMASGADRVIFSNELLGYADRDAIERICASFGSARVSVFLAVRPIAEILPSYWQERVKAGATKPFAAWLETVMASRPVDPDATPKDRFWRAERHDHLVARWAKVVGPTRVHVAILDRAQPAQVLRQLAQVLALPAETFEGVGLASNRSLSGHEASALQRLNERLGSAGVGAFDARAISAAIANRMLARDATGSSPTPLPEAVAATVTQIQEEIVAGLQASGVELLGSVELLHARARATDGAVPLSDDQAAALVSDAVIGALGATGHLAGGDAWWSNGFTKGVTVIRPRTALRALARALSVRIASRIRRVARWR